jgi:hypothetical protein
MGTGAVPDCTSGTCNPINFTVLKPSDWKQGIIVSIRIDGKGLDPVTQMNLKLLLPKRVPHTKFFTPFMRKCKVNFLSSSRAETCSSH